MFTFTKDFKSESNKVTFNLNDSIDLSTTLTNPTVNTTSALDQTLDELDNVKYESILNEEVEIEKKKIEAS